MSTDTPRIEVTVAAPVDAVWAAMRDKKQLRHWHGWDFDGLDAEIDLIYFSAFTENAGDPDARVLEVQGGDRFVVQPDGDGTRITLTRAGLSGDAEWDAFYHEVTEGWITFLHQLKFLLERQPGTARRTLFFAGDASRTGPVIAELGLSGIASQPPGSAFAADLAGEDVKGEVWFRSEYQLGITVDAWGHDGLLVVSYLAPRPDKPNGAAMAVLSTYRLDEPRYHDLSDRWTAWWGQRYRTADEE